jgi:pre-mRNA branch site protein p14
MGDFVARRSANVSNALVTTAGHPPSGVWIVLWSYSQFIPFLTKLGAIVAIVSRISQSRLPPEVNRILYVRNLPFNMTAEELYGIFGKYGAVYQIRVGDRHKDTRGTAFVVYEDIYDAKAAVDHLSGFNVGGRYLVVLYYQPAKFQKRAEAEEKQKELEELRRRIQAKKVKADR